MLLRGQSRRFSDFKRGVGGISQRMLTLTLRNLERDGLVTRTATPSIPPRVDYELTELGHSLAVPIQALAAWAPEHMDRIDAAQATYDEKENAAQVRALALHRSIERNPAGNGLKLVPKR